MPNPLDRLRELWAKKPHTMPEGLEIDMPLGEVAPNGKRILLALAESRLMDLLPEGWSLFFDRGGWCIADECDCGCFGYDKKIDRLSALIAWAESDQCKEPTP